MTSGASLKHPFVFPNGIRSVGKRYQLGSHILSVLARVARWLNKRDTAIYIYNIVAAGAVDGKFLCI